MTWFFDALEYVPEWPGDDMTHITRFNPAWLAVITGLLNDLEREDQWNGTPEQQAEMVNKVIELRQVINTPYECPSGGGGAMQYFVADHFVPAGGASGPLYAGENPVDIFARVTRDDIGISKASDSEIYLPAGDWEIDWWHSVRIMADARRLQSGLLRWAVPQPQIYYWGEAAYWYGSSNTHTLHGHASISIDNTWPLTFLIATNFDMTHSDAQGFTLAGHDAQCGRIVITRNTPEE